MRILLLALYVISFQAFTQSIPEQVLTDWDILTKNGGTWVSKDNTGDYDAWGMEFSWGLNKKSLDATLYAIKDDQNIGTIWDFKIYYHPSEQKIVIDQWGSDGSFAHGDIKLMPDGISESVSSLFNTDRSIFRIKHVQKIDGDMMYSDTFTIDENGDWKKSQTYIWKRV